MFGGCEVRGKEGQTGTFNQLQIDGEEVRSYNSIADPAFQKLTSEYGKLLSNSDLIKSLKSRSFTQLFLERGARFFKERHPTHTKLQSYEGSSPFIASKEIVDHYSRLLKDERLTEESRSILREWIVGEIHYLPLAVFMTTLSADISYSGIFKYIFSNPLEYVNTKVPICAKAISDHLSKMEPGEKFKMYAGFCGHGARMVLKANENDTFTVFYYDTGVPIVSKDGSIQTAFEFVDIPKEKLTDPSIWEELILNQIDESSGMDVQDTQDQISHDTFLKYLNNIGKIAFLPRELQRSKQIFGSCGFSSIKAEFKHTFIAQHRDREEGLEQYKIFMTLLADHAEKEPIDSIDPLLKEIFSMKQEKRHIYLKWMEICKDSKSYEALKGKYVEVIKKISNQYNLSIDIDQLLKGRRPFYALRLLNEQLESCIEQIQQNRVLVSKEELLEELEIPDEIWKEGPLFFRERKTADMTRNYLMDKLIANRGVKNKSLLVIQNLWGKMTYSMRPDILECDAISPSMIEQIGSYEQEANYVPFFQELVDSPFFKYLSPIFEALISKGWLDCAKIVAKKYGERLDELNSLYATALLSPEKLQDQLTQIGYLEDYRKIKILFMLSKQKYELNPKLLKLLELRSDYSIQYLDRLDRHSHNFKEAATYYLGKNKDSWDDDTYFRIYEKLHPTHVEEERVRRSKRKAFNEKVNFFQK